MDVFLKVVTSFPTVVYSVLLLVMLVHWLMTMLGVLEIDAIDGLLPDEIGLDGGDGAHHGGLGGLLLKFGLHGIPVMVVFTIIAIVGWSFCFFVELHVLGTMPDGVATTLLGVATMVGGLLLSIPVARIVLAPVRRLMRRYEPVTQRPLLGRYAEVRSPEITQTHGTAWVEDGGAGLILQVRADLPGRFVRGDRVVLIEYLDAQNAYRVTSTEEFERL
ncbi:MAG: hypothetical protein KF800_13365 [Lysobacter sp.]|nr:hypothetical protein [Lysobacter sp.]